MNEQKENLIVWSCSISTHEHNSWEEAELCSGMQTQVTKLENAAILLLISSLNFLTAVRQQLPTRHEQIEDARLEIYQRLRTKYDAAGKPYGADDKGLWQWLQNQAGRR